MISSTSNSSATLETAPTSAAASRALAGALARPRTRRVLGATMVTLAVFAAFVAAGLVVDRALPQLRVDTPYQAGIPDVSRDWYLSSDPSALDFDALYNGWWGTVEDLRRADVLFLGNSRGLYAFRPEVFQPYLDRVGLRGYNLSFSGSADGFPRAIIRRHDLHPRFVIVNSDGFFLNDFSIGGRDAMARTRWESWRYFHERVASWEVRKRLHLVVPPWREYLFGRRENLAYRSARTGAVRWVQAEDKRGPIAEPLADHPSPEQEPVIDDWVERQAPHLALFVREINERGGQVILTLVPYGDQMSYWISRRLAERFGLSLIIEWPEGLEAQSGSHMNLHGSQIYVGRLMERFLALPVVASAARPVSRSTASR